MDCYFWDCVVKEFVILVQEDQWKCELSDLELWIFMEDGCAATVFACLVGGPPHF